MAKIYILVADEWVEGTPANGEKFKKISDTGVELISFYSEPVAPPARLPLSGLLITRNGGLDVPSSGQKYYLDAGDTVEVTCTIEGGEAINAPIIKLPITRHSDDTPTPEELYFTGSIVAGVMTVTGTFAMSSNYKALNDRCNRALDRMPANFHVSFETIDFLV